ncbi:MIF4G domain-containing protein [Colletotrichum musicola]|uniref:MIF4G domain-containing protein n=1 Tax=Colletotrichum musicola TaxID=2175873 RepID=A0A8H6NBD9_9PEZI|nr:MIF4G domain-containing protein [Colletotrichum musicola]
MPQKPQPLALPTKLLQEIGASDQASVARSRGRWKSQDQNRKDRRKAERQLKKHRSSDSRRAQRPTSHSGAGEVFDSIDDGDSHDDTSGGAVSHQHPKSLKKRKRNSLDDGEDDNTTLPAARQPSRAVREKLAKDDAEIDQLERKLGLKKGRKSLPKAFKDDGLEDLLGGLSGGSDDDEGATERNEAREWLAHKRRKATGTLNPSNNEYSGSDDYDKSDMSERNLLGDESGSDLEDHGEQNDDDGNTDEETTASEGADSSGDEHDDELASHESFHEFDSETESTGLSKPERVRENPYLPPIAADAQVPKYVPPSMRAKSKGDDDLEARIRRKLQGPVNRLTEASMISIVGEIEKVYREYPRGHTNNVLADLLMAQDCVPTSKPDTLLVLSAGFVAAVYKVVGVDFAAHFLTTLVEKFQQERQKAIQVVKEQRIPTKETSNLLTVLAELYIFRVIASNLMFDLVRLLLGDLSELNAELLLRIVRLAGPQLRKDDPLALKDIVGLIRPAVAKIGESNLSVRTKFMIETISDLKNNKLKAGEQDLAILNEHVTRIRKVLGALDTQKVKATEPLRVGLGDLENADKTGKWWLIGASWVGPGVREEHERTKQRSVSGGGDDGEDEEEGGDALVNDSDDLVTHDYTKLAREQGMNTDVRRAIFIALVAAADYQDAYMRILKLRLNKYNRREVPNVLVQCAGAQLHYNPYYTLVAKKFCSDSRIKYAFQDTVWALFRRLGEPLFGEEPEEEDEEAADDRRLINTAKMMGSLVADGSVSLAVLKPLNLAYIKDTTNLFVEVMLITVLQECGRVKNRKIEQALDVPFGTGLAPELARSVAYFLRKKVRNTDLLDDKKDAKKIRQACKVAETLLRKPAQDDGM